MQELEVLLQGLARKQCQRLHLARVKASGFYGIVHPQPPSSSQANDIARDARLRSQILEDSIEIAVQPLFSCLFLATTFAKSAHVERQRVDSSRRQFPGYLIPRLTIPVALVEQQHTGAGLGRGKIARLQDGAIGGLQVNHTCSWAPRGQLRRRRARGGCVLCAPH